MLCTLTQLPDGVLECSGRVQAVGLIPVVILCPCHGQALLQGPLAKSRMATHELHPLPEVRGVREVEPDLKVTAHTQDLSDPRRKARQGC